MIAFEDYVSARWHSLVRAAVLMGADQHAAEDAVQTALAKCFLSWDRVIKAREPDAYVYRILFNTLGESRRRRWMAERPTAILPERPGKDALTQVDENHALLDALRALPVGQREVVVLRFFADYTEPQTAQALGIALGTVKSRTARALATLADDPRLSFAERNPQS